MSAMHLHALPVPHRWHGITWHRLPSYLLADWQARHRHQEPCGCLIENVALYGHRDRCPQHTPTAP